MGRWRDRENGGIGRYGEKQYISIPDLIII
jgi:hypothetical protein